MNRYSIIKPLLVSAFLLIAALQCFAGIDSHVSQTANGPFSSGAILVNNFTDPKFSTTYWGNFTDISVKNAVTLRVNDNMRIGFDFDYTVRVKIDYVTTLGGATYTDYHTLSVTYRQAQGVTYKGLDSYTDFQYGGAYSINVTVDQIYTNTNNYNLITQGMVSLNASIIVNRKYNFHQADRIPNLRASINSYKDYKENDNKQLQILWAPTGSGSTLSSAEEYDIEWTTLDKGDNNETLAAHMANGALQWGETPDILFQNNATRITTTGIDPTNSGNDYQYNISLVYNNDYLVVRMRQVQYTVDGVRMEGDWNYNFVDQYGTAQSNYLAWDLSTASNSALYWYHSDLNWQYSAAFAEDGKKKEVISYFDGSLRGRQTVTINNSDNVAVVQENVYDEFGRPAASILPAPAFTNDPLALQYFQNFNRSAGVAYNYSNIAGLSGSNCETVPAPLDNAISNPTTAHALTAHPQWGGAANYYSPSNAFLAANSSDPKLKYIPDADGYPLSVTQYTADNTGRIKLQGGVGLTFQPGTGSVSKTTKYFYGKPEQWELDQLFGNDVGYAEHYLKNMVVDPNNQVSVSYINGSGKTIATALAGSNPKLLNGDPMLDALPSANAGKQQTINLIKPEQFVYDGGNLKLSATSTYLSAVAGTNTVTVNYSVEQLVNAINGQNSQSVCSSCFYELHIIVKDDCNNPCYQATEQIGSIANNCGTTAPFTKGFTFDCTKIGEYYVTFELVLSKSQMEDYVDNYIHDGQSKGIVSTEWSYLQTYLNGLDFSGCLADCKTYMSVLGTRQEFTDMFLKKMADMGITSATLSSTDYTSLTQFIDTKYTSLYNNYTVVAAGCVTSPCEKYEEPMKKDVSPGGQYGLYDANYVALEPEINVLYQNWRTVFPILPSTSATYQSELITKHLAVDYSSIADPSTLSITSPYDATFTFADLIKYWKPDWAAYFLPFHPEYCKLRFCYLTSDSRIWDEKINGLQKAADIPAVAGAGVSYSNTTGEWLLAADPFFQSGPGAAYHDYMLQDLRNYSLNVLKLPVISGRPVKNISQMVDFVLYCSYLCNNSTDNATSNCWNNCDASSCRMDDRNWDLYKTYYFDLKNTYYDLASQGVTCPNSCPVGTPISATQTSDCATPADFSIAPASEADRTAYGAIQYGMQLVTITYLPGNLNSAVSLNMYYPSGTSTGGAPTLLQLPAGTSKQYLLIPVEMPVNTVKISAVTCVCGNIQLYDNQSFVDRYEYGGGGGILYEYSIEQGTADSPPQDMYCLHINSDSSLPVFYSCITFAPTNGGQSTTYNNVWVFTCSSTYSTDPGGGGIGTIQNEFVQSGPSASERYDGNDVVVNTSAQSFKKKNISIAPDYNIPQLKNPDINYPLNAFALSGGDPTAQYATDYYIAWSVTGPSGTTFTVNVKPNIVRCTRYGMVATLNIYAEGSETPTTVTVNIDPVSYTGTITAPGITTNFAAVYVSGFVTNCSIIVPAGTGCPEAYKYKTSRFPIIDKSVRYADPTTAVSNGYDQIQQQVVGSCESNADSWIKILTDGLTGSNGVGATPYDIALLKQRLIAVCELGGDINHPLGSSTVPNAGILPSTGSAINNFGDAILQTFPSLSGKFTPGLNPWLLDGPGPYSPVAQYSLTTLSSTNSDIAGAISYFVGQTPGGTSTWQYLKNTFGDDMFMSEADFNALAAAYGHCNNLLPHDMTIPVFLQKAGQGYANATAYTNAKNSLSGYFASPTALQNSNDYQRILTTYLNQTLGFVLSYDQYQNYETVTLAANPNALLVNAPPFQTTSGDLYGCIEATIASAVNNAENAYNGYINDQKDMFRQSYIATCAAAKTNVIALATQPVYHYTLYYYDQADNLVRTIPPEGVNIIEDPALLQQIQYARANPDAADCATNYNGPANASTPAQGFGTTMENLLDVTPGTPKDQAMEFWLYNPANQLNQLIEETDNKKYLFQICINGRYLNIDLYSSTPTVTGGVNTGITYTLSQHFAADINSMLPLKSWQHLLVQGTDMPVNGMQVYLNGTQLTPAANLPPAACSWTVDASTGVVTYPNNITMLKHLRLYDRKLQQPEISANAGNPCFAPTGAYITNAWYRFNIPAAGGPTTIADNSTVESMYSGIYPNHALATSYQYNSTNQVALQNSPDGGSHVFWYDMVSRLNVSQNAKQSALQQHVFSYTQYDALGRIIEVGQKANAPTLPGSNGMPSYLSDSFVQTFNTSGTNSQITHTYYDGTANYGAGMFTIAEQDNLRKRVAATTYTDGQAGSPLQATYYNYDIDGNVKTLWQQIGGLTDVSNLAEPTKLKRIDYEYDLISGKVNFVRYQDHPVDATHPAQPDRFYYQYKYDAENRLTEAWSSVSAMVDAFNGSALLNYDKKQNAYYRYYLHGPLARLELGDQYGRVQGLDYAYTLQGWLKGVNGGNLTADIGNDNVNTNPTKAANDAYAYSLGYYTGDYKPIGSSSAPAFNLAYQANAGDITGQGLYNGNITNTTLALNQLNSGAAVGYTYYYDQLNRLKKMRQHEGISNQHVGPSGTGWDRNSMTDKYAEDILLYDGNGNIINYNRNGGIAGNTAMDVLSYGYNYVLNTATGKQQLVNNRLRHVKDALLNNTSYTTDLKNQPDDNYTYDGIGNMTGDNLEGITGNANGPGIDWTVYGKIKAINKGSGNSINYTYNPTGQRISKTLTYANNAQPTVTTYYVRDAQGNTLGVYDNANSAINWKEQDLYGSSRLGMWTPNINLATAGAETDEWTNVGHINYELNNHLGNVLATITDKRLQIPDGSNAAVDHYEPDVATQQDYYPFGMLQEGRQYTANNTTYRYGFNGKENDNEVKKDANGNDLVGGQQDYGMRIYDPRVGRFLTVDPLTAKYPELTPYQFASNTPVQATDLDGLEANFGGAKGKTFEYKFSDFDILNPTDVPQKFLSNVGIYGYNSALDLAEYLANINPIYNVVTKGAGIKKVFHGVVNTCSNAMDYWVVVTLNPDKLQTDINNTVTSPHFYEQLTLLGLTHYIGGEIKFTGFTSELSLVRYEGFGGDILANSSKTTTVLGRFSGAIEKLKNTGVFSTKGLRFLNVENWTWEKNVKFLDEAIARNDNIRLVSDPNNLRETNVWDGNVMTNERTTFGKEIDYLKNKGYVQKGNEMVKPK